MLLTSMLSIVALYNVALIIVCLRKTRPKQPGRNIIWFIGSVTAWVICESVLDMPGTSRSTIILIAHAMYACGAVGLCSWLWFCAEFPVRASVAFRRTALALTAVGTCFFLLSWTPGIIVGSTAPPWQDHLVRGKLLPLYAVWFLTCYILGIINLWRSRQRLQGLARLQARYVLLGNSLTIGIAFFFDILMPQLVPSFRYGYWGPVFSIIMTTLMTYAIVRYRLFDITLVYRTGAVYSVTIGIITGLFALIVPVVDSVLIANFHFPTRVSSFVIAFLVMLAFQPVRRAIQVPIDRYFFRSVYDSRRVLQQTGDIISLVRDRVWLGNIFTDALERTLRPQQIALYIAMPDHTFLRLNTEKVSSELPATLSTEHPIAEFTRQHDEIVVVDELAQSSPSAEIVHQFRACNVALSIPFFVQRQCYGMALLGQKLSGDPPSNEDISMLSVLRAQIALVLANIVYFEEINAVNTTLEQRVLERTRELQIANEQLQEADKAKDHLLAIVSHELLTPLTIVLGWTECALEAKTLADAKRAIEVIRRNALRQRSTIHDLLDVSRLIFNKLYLDIELVDLRTVLQHNVEYLRPEADSRGIILDLRLPESSLMVKADTRRLQQVITNLLSNALKFTKAGDAIAVSAYTAGPEHIFIVRDTGIGIDTDLISQVFISFKQVGKDKYKGGLGLGLSLVKGIIEAHKGSVVAESQGIGHGSTFTVRLPSADAVQSETNAALEIPAS